ncbi:MAG: EI24 domain-containing protein [Bacteroidales bacterium]
MSRFFNLFSQTISLHGEALRLIRKQKMMWVFLVPFLLFILLAIGGFMSISYMAGIVGDHLESAIQFDEGWVWLTFIINSFLIVFLRILLFIFFGFFSGYIVLLLMSPLFSYISERTEQYLTGHSYPFSAQRLLRETFRGIVVVIRNVIIQGGIFLAVFIFSFIPLLGQIIGGTIGSVFLFTVSAYFYGFSFMDYTIERQNVSISQGARYIHKRKGAAVGLGFIYGLLLFIPFLGMFISSYFAIISTVAGCIYVMKDAESTIGAKRSKEPVTDFTKPQSLVEK